MLKYQKIPGFAYSVDTDGRIWGLLDNVPVPHQTRDDGVYVTLKFLGVEVQLNLAILVLLTFAINNRDVGMLDFIVPMFKNGDNTDCKLSNLTYRFKPKSFIDDYYLIPFYTNYLVNKEGVVIRASDGMKLTPHVCKSGYLNYGLRRDLGFIEGTKQSTVGVHRLIALALLQYPVNVDELMVNHIDGIKLNNFVDNFEWVTPKENIVHAVVNGLRSDNQPVLYRDLLKNTEVETYSISECARILGVPHNVIIQRLKKPGQPIWPGGLQFKLKSDPTPWREPLDLISELKSMKSATSIKVFNIQSGEISLHPDATKAGEYAGVNPSTVKWQLNKAKIELPIHGFLFRYEWDKRDLPTFTEFQLMCFAANPKDTPTPVCCFDMVTSIETLYTSVADASMKLGINPNTIKTCIRSTRPFSKRYKFMYVDLLTLEPIPRN